MNVKTKAMKKLRDKVEHHVLMLEGRWNTLSAGKQRFMTKVFFGSYVLLTVVVLIQIMVSTDQRSNTMSINHIDGIAKKATEKASVLNDTVASSIKKSYERFRENKNYRK